MQCGASRMENILDCGEAAKHNCVCSRAVGARKKQRREQRAHVDQHVIYLSYKQARFFIARFLSRLILGSCMRAFSMMGVFVMIATIGSMSRRHRMRVMSATAERRVGGRQGNHQESRKSLHVHIVTVRSKTVNFNPWPLVDLRSEPFGSKRFPEF